MDNLQDEYSPGGVCFGCGPSNAHGLHIKSRPEGDVLVADWEPKPYHTGYAGFTNGGIISTLLDCHGNMAAAYALMKARRLESPPGTVTAELTVRFVRPTPIGKTLHLRAWSTGFEGDKVRVEGTLEVDGTQTASLKGLYVAVREDHPGFDKWR